MRNILTILLLLSVQLIRAQQDSDEQLALQFYNNKEYDKAIIYYEKLYDKKPDQFYQVYFFCLLQTKDLKKAEKIVKRQLKQHPDKLTAYLDLSMIYTAQEDDKKAKEQLDRAIKELTSDYQQISSLASAFVNAKLFDYAILTYDKAVKLNGGSYPYFYEKAEVFLSKGDTKAMINEYLDALEFRESEMITVQGKMQNALGYDDEKGGFNNPVLKQELMKRIQESPDKIIFSEFLIFIQMQQKDFEGAFAQTKALDKRNKENGFRLMELGKIAASNENYEIAEKAYSQVLTKGKENPYYDQAYIESANAQYDKIVKQQKYSLSDLNLLDEKLKTTIYEFGTNQFTLPLIRKQAKLYAYYLNRTPEAIILLNDAIEIPGLDALVIAETKLDLADAILISGDIWEASLLYSQVEKAYKYEAIGQEAKYRNAKVSYYNGDFKWAKAQLDVLKGATSKLIANDAMELSLVIGDAINIDTNEVPLQMFAAADLLFIQNKTDSALLKLDSINILFHEHSLADNIYFKKGEVYLKKGNYKEALNQFNRITEAYGEDLFGDDALFKTAEIYEIFLNDNEKAKQLYQEMLTKYPSSVYAVESRKRFRKLRGDSIN